jgi:hypothetical protein
VRDLIQRALLRATKDSVAAEERPTSLSKALLLGARASDSKAHLPPRINIRKDSLELT